MSLKGHYLCPKGHLLALQPATGEGGGGFGGTHITKLTTLQVQRSPKKKCIRSHFPLPLTLCFSPFPYPYQATILNTELAYFSASQDYCGQPPQGRSLLRLDLKRNLQFIWICFLEKLFLFFRYHYT